MPATPPPAEAGLPPAVPDASTLRLMTELAARLLPHGTARAGLRDPVRVHLVLTGPGGGTWDVVVGVALIIEAFVLAFWLLSGN